MKKLNKVLISALMILSLGACSSGSSSTGGKYTAGTYSASTKGFGGDVTVTLTVDSDKITDVVVEGNDETPAVGGAALETLQKEIIDKQSSEIDIVSGATVTSTAVQEATKAALAKAEGNETSSTNTYKAGTYTASAQGHNATVTLDVTFSEDAITGIEVKQSYESPGVSDSALNDLPEEIIEHQTLNVDTIAGATVSSNAVLSAVKDAVTQAGGDPSNLQTPVEKEASESNEYTADVVILGGGGAGLSAAVSATDEGKSVIILEKEGYVGGNTMVSGGIYNCPDPDLQSQVEMTDGVKQLIEDAISAEPVNDEHAELIKKVTEEWNEYKASGRTDLFDSVNWFTLQTYNAGDHVGDLKLISTMTENAKDTLDWLQEHGYEYQDRIVQGAGSLYQRTHKSVDTAGIGFIKALTNTLESRDCKIMLNTASKHIVLDENGKAVSVKAEDRDGNEYTINANNGVVLSTGGFAGNLEMVQKYNTSGKWPDLTTRKSTNLPGMTGDGITMATEIGAGLRDMDQIQLLQTTSPKTGNCTFGYVAPQEAEGYLFVNSEGKRFIGEDGRRDDISLAALAQTDGLFYMLESGSVITDPDNTKDLTGVPLNELLNSGDVIKGDTLEDLCEKVGWDYETVKAEVDSYNENVKNNASTDEYGRKLFTILQEDDPWYAIPRTPSVHHTMGGVTIDTNAEVLSQSGEVIPSLYAAGEVIGGIHGGNRVGGNAIVDCLVFGRIAGRNAALNNAE